MHPGCGIYSSDAPRLSCRVCIRGVFDSTRLSDTGRSFLFLKNGNVHLLVRDVVVEVGDSAKHWQFLLLFRRLWSAFVLVYVVLPVRDLRICHAKRTKSRVIL